MSENETKKHKYICITTNNGEELKAYLNQDGDKLQVFGPVSRINILVGATNSGKSRFMRGLMKNPPTKFMVTYSNQKRPDEIFNIWEKHLVGAPFQFNISINPKNLDYKQLKQEGDIALLPESLWLEQKIIHAKNPNLEENIRTYISNIIMGLKSEFQSTQISRNLRNLETYLTGLKFASSEPNERDKRWVSITKQGLNDEINQNIETIVNFAKSLPERPFETVHLSKLVYIPVLRTAVDLKEITPKKLDASDPLQQAIEMNYGFNLSKNTRNQKERPIEIEVFTGNSLYVIVEEERSGKAEIYSRLKEFERFLTKNFFEDLSIELRALNENHELGQRLALFISEEYDRAFKDIGEGIQAIIILMYRLFTAEPNTWIFIEEPEQGLHPGLQRIFLERLANEPAIKEKNLTIFMTTHSNHLLGIAMSELKEDVSVFAFQKRMNPEQFQIRPIVTPEANLLDLLGVSNTSVFLANCGIWVEGVTDRQYVRAYLDAYLDTLDSDQFRPQEDIHYAFFEYAGSNLDHYFFDNENEALLDEQVEEIRAQFLCNRIFLLADQDKDKEDKHERLRAIQTDNFQYMVTGGVEIENLINDDQLKKALPDLIQGLTGADIKKEIDRKDFKDERLGAYLSDLIVKDKCPKLSKKSGTLSYRYKKKLPSIVCHDMKWEEMSEDARELAKAVYSFIEKHNQIKS